MVIQELVAMKCFEPDFYRVAENINENVSWAHVAILIGKGSIEAHCSLAVVEKYLYYIVFTTPNQKLIAFDFYIEGRELSYINSLHYVIKLSLPRESLLVCALF